MVPPHFKGTLSLGMLRRIELYIAVSIVLNILQIANYKVLIKFQFGDDEWSPHISRER